MIEDLIKKQFNCLGDKVDVYDSFRSCRVVREYKELKCPYLFEGDFCRNSKYRVVRVQLENE